jgi:hypothetical protein
VIGGTTEVVVAAGAVGATQVVKVNETEAKAEEITVIEQQRQRCGRSPNPKIRSKWQLSEVQGKAQ